MAANAEQQTKQLYEFGPFRVDPEKELLFRGNQTISLAPKTFQVLLVLMRHNPELVTKEDLMNLIWPDTFVEEANLSRHIFLLRKALGEDRDDHRYIVTAPGRGYRFVAPLTVEVEEARPATPEAPVAAIPQELFLHRSSRRRWMWLAACGVVAAALTVSLVYFVHRRTVETHRAEAVQEIRQGRELWRRRTPETLTQAIDHYNKALQLEPANAAAYSGLADAYIVLPFLSTIRQDVAFPKAIAAAERAVTLAPSLAEAHTSLADVKLYVDWDFAGAEREFQRALALDPNYATAHQWYAGFLSLMGRHEEAIKETLRAEQLEPLSVMMYHHAGQVYQNARQYDNAIHQYERALEIDSTFFPSCMRLADAFRHKGMYRESLETLLESYHRHAVDFYAPGAIDNVRTESMARAFAANGVNGFWRARLESLKDWDEHRVEAELNVGAMGDFAVTYAQLGDNDTAVRWLNELYKLRGYDILRLKVDPDFDPLRADPRFQELIRRIGFP